MSILHDFEPTTEWFIETGTGSGETLALSSKAGYNLCQSIESDGHIYLRNEERFKSYDNVVLHHGLSWEVLPEIMDWAVTTTFWLDAHWTGGKEGEAKPDIECPLLLELAVILALEWETAPRILIDDSFMFKGEFWLTPESHPFDPANWPNMREIASVLHDYVLIDHDFYLEAILPSHAY